MVIDKHIEAILGIVFMHNIFMMRLFEIHLLCKGLFVEMDKDTKAVKDINAIRNRANASLINAREVSISFTNTNQLKSYYVQKKVYFAQFMDSFIHTTSTRFQ